MPSLNESRAEVLDVLWAKNNLGQLTWSPRSSENSFETDVGAFSFHVDQKSSGEGVRYRIWAFSPQGEALDNYDPATLDKELRPDDDHLSTYVQLAHRLYNNIRDSFALQKLAPALDALRALRGEET